MTVFTLPDLGEGLQEAEIVAWHVAPGDRVVADQPMVSVETDKAVIEVPSPVSGTIARRFGEEGVVVAVGAPLAEIETTGAADAGAIVGELPAPPAGEAPSRPASAQRPKAMPAVRRLAREHGIDLSGITGSGPDGAILTRDVAAAATAGTGLRGLRGAMARAMARSRDAVVPATVTERAVIAAWPASQQPTPRLIVAIVAGCAASPALNAHFDGTRRVLHEQVDLAIAVDTPDGLLAPVLPDVAGGGDLAERLSDLRHRAIARRLRPEELHGGSITLSNFGTLGGRYGVLVVTPPQVAILGAGRIAEECVAEAGRPVVRRVLPLSLTFDHRAVTGAEAARFLGAVRTSLEQPTIEEAQP